MFRATEYDALNKADRSSDYYQPDAGNEPVILDKYGRVPNRGAGIQTGIPTRTSKNSGVNASNMQVSPTSAAELLLAQTPAFSFDPGSVSAESKYKDSNIGSDSFRDAFLNKLYSFKENRYVYNMYKTEAEVDRLQKELDNLKKNGGSYEDRVSVLRSLLKEKDNYNSWVDDVNRSLWKMDKYAPTEARAAREKQLQDEPFSGTNPLALFQKDKNDILDFIKYELPGDLAGSYAETGTVLLSTFGPMAVNKATAAILASLKAPGPWQAVISTVAAAASLYGSAKLQQVARDRESQMEAGEALSKSIEKQVQQYYEEKGKAPSKEEMAGFRDNALERIEQLRDVTNNMLIEDWVQAGLGILPWTNVGNKLIGVGKMSTALKSVGALSLSSFMEAVEESDQFIGQKQYEEGTLPDKTNTFDFWFDTKKKSVMALLGAGDPAIMNDSEWGNSVRAGALLGGGHIAVSGGLAFVAKAYEHSKDNSITKNLLLENISNEYKAYRASVLNKFYTKGKTEEYINILEGLKDSKFAKENDITNDRIDEEIKQAKRSFLNLKYLNSPSLRDLDSSEKVKGLELLVDAQESIEKAYTDIEQYDAAVSGLYETADLASVKGSAFVSLNKLKNEITAIDNKLKILDDVKDGAAKSMYDGYSGYLNGRRNTLLEEYKNALKTSNIAEDAVMSTIDLEVSSNIAKRLDSEFELIYYGRKYTELTNPVKLKENIASFTKADEVIKEQVDKGVKDVAEEETKAKEGPAIVFDNAGNQYSYDGIENGKHVLTNLLTGEKTSKDPTAVVQLGLKYFDTDKRVVEAPPYEDANGNTLLFEGTSQKGNYLFRDAKTGQLQELTKEQYKAAGIKAKKAFVGEQSVEEGKTVVDQVAEERKANEAVAADTKQKVMDILKGKATEEELKELLIKEQGNRLTFFEVSTDGTSFTIQGVKLTNKHTNPLHAAFEENGKVVSVIMTREDTGNKVVITNPVIANDLALSIALVEEVRNSVLTYMKESNEDFILVKHAGTGKEFQVFTIDGAYSVINPKTGAYTNASIEKEVLATFFDELNRRVLKLKELKDSQVKLTDKQIQDELRGLNDIIRPATAGEINQSNTAAEISNAQGTRQEKTGQTDEPNVKTEDEIIEDKAEEIADKVLDQPVSAEVKPEESPIVEPISDEEIPEAAVRRLERMTKGLSDMSSAAAYKASDNPEFDQWISDKNNKLNGYSVEFQIDFDYVGDDFNWADNAELKKAMQDAVSNGTTLSPSVRAKILARQDDKFTAFLDKLPIRLILRDKEGNVVDNSRLYYHRTDYNNIAVPKSIENDIKATATHRISERNKVRNKRVQIITDILNGGQPTITRVSKNRGVFNNKEAGTDNRNENVTRVFKNLNAQTAVLGVAGNDAVIRKAGGKELVGEGHPGSIFLETTDTANGEVTNVKLNPSKLSVEHAKILLSAYIQSFTTKGGYSVRFAANSLTKDGSVENMTTGEIIHMLVLEGKKYTDQSVEGKPQDHLIPKQLWVEGGKLYFGTNVLDLKSEVTKEEVDLFVKWATENKNYAFDKRMLGKTFDKDFKVGNIKVKSGQSYEKMLLDNGMLLSDLKPELPIHAPVVILDFSSYDKKRPTPEVKAGKDVEQSPEQILSDLAPFRMVSYASTSYNQIVAKKALKWLKKRIGGKVEIVDDFIRLGDVEAFGLATRDAVILSRLAEEGSEYHEAFHRVSLGILSNEQRLAIYAEARKKWGLAEMTDKAVEEFLAEKYRDYQMAEDKKIISLPAKIRQFFERLYDIVYTMFTGEARINEYEIDKVFEGINLGKFRYAKAKNLGFESYNLFTAAKNRTGFSASQTKTIVKNIAYLSFKLNDITKIADLENLKVEKVFGVFEKLRDGYRKEADKAIEDGNTALAEAKENLHNVFKAVTDRENWSLFKDLTNDYLLSLKIRNVEDLTDVEYDKGNGATGFERIGRESYEVDLKDNMLASIKMLIMSLPESKEADSFTGLFNFVDFGSTWNRLMNDLHKHDNVNDMLATLDKKGETITAYEVLSKKLKEDETDRLKTQFEVSFRKFRHNFVDITYEQERKSGTIKFNFQNTDVQNATKLFAKEWGQQFAKGDLFSDKSGLLSKEIAESAVAEYKDIIKTVRGLDAGIIFDYDAVVDRLTSLFGTFNIPLDKQTVAYAVADKDEFSTKEQALRDLIVNDLNNIFTDSGLIIKRAYTKKLEGTKGKPIKDEDIFVNEKGIRDVIAKYYIMSKPDEMLSTVLGPEGNQYYVFDNNSYLTDVTRRITKDDSYVNKLKTVVGNANSMLLQQFSTNPDIRKAFNIKTFSGFIKLNAKDDGKGYTDLTDLEDFLFKLSAVHKGHLVGSPKKGWLPLPTMADRRKYHLLDGIELLDFKVEYENGKSKLPANSEAVNYLINAAIDEYNRAELVKKQIEDALDKKDTTGLKENVHYRMEKETKGATKYEKIDKGLIKVFTNSAGEYVANGTKFMHLGMFNGTAFDPNNRTAIKNALTKSAAKLEDAGALLQRINDTIVYATEIGAIKSIVQPSGFSKITENLFIDSDLVTRTAEKEFGGDKIAALYKILANYTVNTMMSSIEVEKLFSGDMASYKGKILKEIAEDKIKRLTALAATGENLRTEFPVGHELYNKKTYNVATLNSSIIESVYYKEMYDKHLSLFLEEFPNTPLDKAEDIVKGRLNAYLSVDQTDAQSYISPNMYRSVQIRLGEWTDEMQEAFDLLQSNRKLTRGEEATALAVVMPPLKLVSFYLEIENGLATPIYDKMSMAVLFRSFVSGTELENLLDRMEATGKYSEKTTVDMIKFDTVVKVGNRHRINYYKKSREGESIVDFNDTDLHVVEQDFESLRRQQITEPHDVDRVLLGTQVRKILMSNIMQEGLYNMPGSEKPVTGKELANIIMSSMNKLSDMGKASLLKSLGLDEKDGKLVVTDRKKLYGILREDAKRSGMSNSIIDALDTSNANTLPIDALPERKWIQSRLVSMVAKKTVDLMLPGNAFIQMSNFGLKRTTISEVKQSITWLNKSVDELDFYRVVEGVTKPLQAIVSVNLFKSVIPNYDKLTFEEKVFFVRNNPEIVGYRIPTQGLSSVSLIQVVGLLPEQMGDTIILPTEFTALTGSDFDIDKLYAFRYNYEDASEITKAVKVDSSLNTREGIENRMIDAYMTILRDSKHYTDLTTPLDAATGKLKQLAKDISKWEGKDLLPDTLYMDSPAYQAAVKAKYTVGKNGIGPFALNNVHHVLGQLANLLLNGNIGIGNVVNNDGTDVTDLSQIYDVDGVKILDWLSALINAHVDIAKEPYIFDLNINDYTYDVTNLMMRAGAGKKSFYFLAQPVLKELAALDNKSANEGLSISVQSPINAIEKEYTNLYNQALAAEKLTKDSLVFENIFNTKTLTKDIHKGTAHDAAYYGRQLKVLEMFRELKRHALSLNELVLYSRVDTKRFGNTLAATKSYIKGVEKVLSDGKFINLGRLFDETFLTTFYNNSVVLIQDLFKEQTVVSSEAMHTVVDAITEMTGNKYKLKETYINALSDELFSIIAADFFNNPSYNINMDIAKVKQLFYGEKGLVDKLHDIKAGKAYPELRDNRLLRILRPEAAEEGSTKPNIIKAYTSNVSDKWDKDDVIRAWEDLIYDDNEVIRKIGRDLVLYAFYTSGMKKGLYSFFQYIPSQYLSEIGYGDYFEAKLNELNTPEGIAWLMNKLDQFFINNWNNKDIVPSIDNIRPGKGKPKMIPMRHPFGRVIGYNKAILFKVDTANAQDYLFSGTNSNNEPVYTPYVKNGMEPEAPLYKYIGYIKNTKEPVYMLVSKASYYDAGVIIKENGLYDTMFGGNEERFSSDQLRYIDNVLTDNIKDPKKFKNDYKGLVRMNTEDLIIDTYKTDVKDIEKYFSTPVLTVKEETPVASIVEPLVEEKVEATQLEIPDFNKVTNEQMKDLDDKYKHCK